MQPTLDQIFNAFCRVVERHADDRVLWNALKRAPICQFDTEAAEQAKIVARAADPREQALPPMMPFDEVALIDAEGVVLFYDAQDYEHGERQLETRALDRNQQLTRVPILRTVTSVIFCYGGMFGPDGWTMQYGSVGIGDFIPDRGRQVSVLAEETRVYVGHGDRVDVAGMASDLLAAKAGRYTTAYNEHERGFTRARVEATTCGLDQLAYIDLPRHHVIVERPVKPQAHPDGPKLPRAHDRDKLRLIDPEKIHTVYPRELSERHGTTTVMPHMRRGHTKYLTSPRFTKKQWTRIRVRPTWIGDPEWQTGNLTYRVLARGNDSNSA